MFWPQRELLLSSGDYLRVESFDEVSSGAGQGGGGTGNEILIIQRISPQEIFRLGYSK